METGGLHMKRIITIIMGVCITISCVACSADDRKKSNDNEVTIYIDETNSYIVRQAIGRYELARKSNSKSYPEISWNLVDKSYMSSEELNAEIYDEIEAGEGPDLVFVDKSSIYNPYELMEKNYLYDMSDILDADTATNTYVPGTLEEGNIDGKQYLIPISVTAPILYTTSDALENLGMKDLEISNMSELFDLAESYKTATGNDIFTDDNMWNNLLMFSGLLDGCKNNEEIVVKLSSNEARDFFARLKTLYSNEERTAYGGYDDITDGKALIGTEIVESICDFYKNAALFKRNAKIQYIDMPDLSGKCTAIITQAVGINKNTKNKQLVYNAIKMFDESHVTASSYLGRSQTANITESRDSNLTSCLANSLMSTDIAHSLLLDESNSGLTDYGGKEFTNIDEITGKNIESVSYYISAAEENGVIMENMLSYISEDTDYDTVIKCIDKDLNKETDVPEYNDIRTISIVVVDSGQGTDCGIYNCLKEVNESLKKDDIWLDISLVHGSSVSYELSLMANAGVEPDMVYMEDYSENNEYTADFENLSSLTDNLYSNWEKCSSIGNKYLPVATMLSGIWYNKSVMSNLNVEMSEINNFDDLISIFDSVSTNGISGFGWTDTDDGLDEVFNMIVNACGSEYYSAENKVVLDKDADIEAFDYMKKMLADNSQLSKEEAISHLKEGSLMAIVGNCSLVKELLDDETLDIGYIPFPAGKNGEQVAMTRYNAGGGFVISSACKYKDDAMTALKQLMNLESFTSYTDSFYMIPVSKVSLSTNKYKNMADWSNVYSNIHRLSETDVFINSPEGLSNFILNYIDSDKTAEQFYDEFENIIKGSYKEKEIEEK